MIGLIIVLIIAAVLAVILLLPLKAVGEYSSQGLLFQLGIGPVTLTLYPREKKPKGKAEKKKPKKEKKKKGPEGEKPPAKPGGSFDLIRQLLPILCQALGKLKGKLRISLVLHYTAGGFDAAETAIQYGRVSAGLGAIQPVLENSFRIESRDIRTAVDFTAEHPVIYLWIQAKIRVGQLLYLAVRYGIACLKVYLAHRKAQKEPAKQQTQEKEPARENQQKQQEQTEPDFNKEKKAV